MLEQATGVSFAVEPVPFVVKGDRLGKGCLNCRKPPAAQGGGPVNPLNDLSGDGGLEGGDDHVQAINRVTAEELEPLRQALARTTPVHALKEGARRGDISYTSPR